MAGFRDDHGAALHRLQALERELEAMRATSKSEASRAVGVPPRTPYVVLSFAACGALIAFGLWLSSPFASAVGASLAVAALVLLRHRGAGTTPGPAAPAGATRELRAPGDALSAEQLSGTGDYELAVHVEHGAGCDGVEVSVRHSPLKLYESSGYYDLIGELRNAGEGDVTGLFGRVDFVDTAGTVHDGGSTVIELLDEFHDAPVRVGDVFVFHVPLVLDPELRRVGLSHVLVRVMSVDRVDSADHAPSRPITLAIEAPVPEGVHLVVRERARDAEGEFEAIDLEIENAGDVAVERLVLRERYHHRDGRVHMSPTVDQVTYPNKPIRPGEVRVVRVRATVDATIERWEPVVVELG